MSGLFFKVFFQFRPSLCLKCFALSLLNRAALEETPSEGREVDDYQPRVVLKEVLLRLKCCKVRRIGINVYFYS